MAGSLWSSSRLSDMGVVVTSAVAIDDVGVPDTTLSSSLSASRASGSLRGSYSWSLSSSGNSTLRRATLSSGALLGVLETLSRNQFNLPPVSTTSLENYIAFFTKSYPNRTRQLFTYNWGLPYTKFHSDE